MFMGQDKARRRRDFPGRGPVSEVFECRHSLLAHCVRGQHAAHSGSHLLSPGSSRQVLFCQTQVVTFLQKNCV
jgi:hypothetical protein